MIPEKSAILLVSFGTSYSEAREHALQPLGRELCEAARGNITPLFYEAYTSKQILHRLRQKQQTEASLPLSQIYEVEEALEDACQKGITQLYVIPTHILPGTEYQRLEETITTYQKSFSRLFLAPALLQQEQDCVLVANALEESLSFQPDREYILMGHGTEDVSHIRYEQLNQAFWSSGKKHVQIALVEGEPGLERAISHLQEREWEKREIVLHPFMVLAGRHARLDMAGETNSFASRLKKEGYQVTSVLHGLAEYPAFRRLYIKRFRQML